MNGAYNGNFIFAQPPGALGRGQKVKYHLISITKSISKIFIPNCVCVLTNKRYKIYQTRFSFCHLGHASGVGLGALGCPGGQKNIFSNMVMETFAGLIFYIPTWIVYYWHTPTQNKHQNFWPRSCRVNKKFGSWIPD